MRQTFADTMHEVGLVDPKLVVLLGDISHFIMQPFARACPGRFYNVGICEQTIISMAAGLAHVGFHPVVHTIAPFIIERGLEQIKMDFCYQSLGGTLVSVGSAFDYSTHGCSHHCYGDLALMKALPGTEVVYPAMPNELNLLFKETYANGKLTYFRLPEHKHDVPIRDEEIRLGKAVVVRKGTDVTIVALGSALKTVMESLPALERQGLAPEVIYPHTIKPFDADTIAGSVSRTRRCLVIEEHTQFGGVGDEVMRAIQAVDGVKMTFINIPDRFLHGYGNYEEHRAFLGMTPENVVRQTLLLCGGGQN
jgi:transketolase